MFILKNAVRNLFRNKGRNILLFAIFLIIILAASVGFIIHNTMKEIVSDYEKRFEITASIKADYFSFLGTSNSLGILNIPKITTKDYESFADSNYVNRYYAYGETPIHIDGLTPLSEEDPSTNNNIVQEREGLDEVFYEVTGKLSGYTDLSQLTDFIEGTKKVIDGKIYENDNECIISEAFATKNNLSVGDTITTKLVRIDAKQQMALKITGIYKDTKQYPASYSADTNPQNEILTNFNTIIKFPSDYYDIQMKYVLTSPSVIDNFENELKKKGLPDGFYLSTNDDEYQSIVAPVIGLKNVTKMFLTVVLLLGIIILMMTVLLSVKERKNEIGVLRARGMSKAHVMLHFIVENSMLVTICLIIGLSYGSSISKPISNKLLVGQVKLIEQQNEKANNTYQNSFFAQSDNDTSFGSNPSNVSLKNITIVLHSDTIIQIILVAFMMCFISSFIGLIYVNRYEPMKILSERD